MTLKLSTAIALARPILNDTDAAAYRYSDADLLAYGNGALRTLPTVKPTLLYTEGEVICATGKALQAVTQTGAHSLVSIVRIKNGNAILPADKASLDAFMPTWMAATPAAAQHWMPVGEDPLRFYLYPPAPASQIIDIIYVRTPGPYTVDEDTGLPDRLVDAVADYMVGMAESRDDEHVNSQRAAQFMAQFAARIGGASK